MGESISNLSSVPVIFVMGPTAGGKSSLAMNLASDLKGEIFNCDSIQCYQGLQIGSAGPTPEEMARIPHHLYYYVKAPDETTAATHAKMFFAQMEKQSKVTFLVGGTGFYFQGIEKGMLPVPKVDQSIQDEFVERFAQGNLWNDLHAVDPQSAKVIHPSDEYRLVRAMEIYRVTGKTLSQIKKEYSLSRARFPFPLLKIGINDQRERLRQRVQERLAKMLKQGFVEEVRALIEQGLQSWTPMGSVGYKEVCSYLTQGQSLDWLQEEIVKNTMGLIKKQQTWFRRDPEIHWYTMDQYSEIRELVANFVEKSRART